MNITNLKEVKDILLEFARDSAHIFYCRFDRQTRNVE